jgi:hypothetical protein
MMQGVVERSEASPVSSNSWWVFAALDRTLRDVTRIPSSP